MDTSISSLLALPPIERLLERYRCMGKPRLKVMRSYYVLRLAQGVVMHHHTQTEIMASVTQRYLAIQITFFYKQ